MMNQYTFLSELTTRYPKYMKDVVGSFVLSAEATKKICEDIGFNGSYLKSHNYNLKTDYDYNVILDYIDENEEITTMLLFHEL